MMEEYRLREIYNYQEEPERNDSLVTWFNLVINKKPSELMIGDIARSIRQNLFLEVALNRGVEELEKNPFAGEQYTGELLEKILLLDEKNLISKKDELKKILKKATQTIDFQCWGYPEEKDEYSELLKELKRIVRLS